MKKCYLGAVAAGLLLLLAPSAPAATWRATSSFTYHGKVITPSRAAAMGLVCAEGLPGTRVARCFRSGSEADRKLKPLVGPARTTARTSFAAADEAWACWVTPYLSLHQDVEWKGWELRLYARQVWYDMGSAYDNQTSSYAMGNHSGHIASEKYANGLGYLYPGNTSYGACWPRMSQYPYKDTTWNNKASSRYRN
jgi:hypothetical protein